MKTIIRYLFWLDYNNQHLPGIQAAGVGISIPVFNISETTGFEISKSFLLNGWGSINHNTLWFIEGIERFYVFQWGSFNEKVHDESLGFVKNLLNNFTEKLISSLNYL